MNLLTLLRCVLKQNVLGWLAQKMGIVVSVVTTTVAVTVMHVCILDL